MDITIPHGYYNIIPQNMWRIDVKNIAFWQYSSVWISRGSSKQKPDIIANLYTYLFPILLKNQQAPITNSCRNKLWPKPILIFSKTEFKILKKKPGDEAFRVSFKFLRRGWYQRLTDFNRFLNIETQSCYFCLVF